MMKNGQTYLKISRYSHRKIFKVCLEVFNIMYESVEVNQFTSFCMIRMLAMYCFTSEAYLEPSCEHS